jgi:hypothetical protein
MTALLDTVDPDGLLEYSVVFTDRSLNHMSQSFQAVMRDISSMLKEVYAADAVALVPGGGSYAMESVARQFGRGAHTLIVRNGWFSFRWSQIFDAGQFTSDTTVCMARQTGNGATTPFAPAPIEEVTANIRKTKPDVVFAPHVETSAGLILPDDYVTALAEAAHEVGALMVLEGSHRSEELASGYLTKDADRDGLVWLDDDPRAVQERYGARWLTTGFEPGDVLIFGMDVLHGAFDNRSETGRCRLSTDSRYLVQGEQPDPRWNGTDLNPHGPGRVFYPGLGAWDNADFQDEWKFVDEYGRLRLP